MDIIRNIIACGFVSLLLTVQAYAEERKLAYIVSDIRIPFWEIMSRGIQAEATKQGYNLQVYTADNLAKNELQNTIKAIAEGVSGIVVSPTNSSACVTILTLAKQANIPVVISDIGTEGGEYVSYISSDNFLGAYELGRVLTKKMTSLKIQDGTVGIIGIPQKRANGKARTGGFMKALSEVGIQGAALEQQVDFSYQETYNFSKKIIEGNPDVKALWLQGSDRYQGALDAIKDTGNEGKILLLTFDAEPEFLDMIPKGILVGAGMQQPFLMGEKAVQSLQMHLEGKDVKKEQKLPVLAVSTENISELMPTIQRNVLGLTD